MIRSVFAARRRPWPRSAFSLVEVLIAGALFCVLINLLIWILMNSRASTASLTSRMAVQQTSRKASARFLAELQEGMEVVYPRPGSTLSHAFIRDKLSIARWFVLLPRQGSTDSYELWRYLADPDLPADRRGERLLSNVKRLTFTSISEGSLQVNLLLSEEGQETALLTTVRLRNLASSEELW
jgi:type II secretory pathway pseudopilin PulG